MEGEVGEPLKLLDMIRRDDAAICCLVTAGSSQSPRKYVGSTESVRPVFFAHWWPDGASCGPFCSSRNLRKNRRNAN